MLPLSHHAPMDQVEESDPDDHGLSSYSKPYDVKQLSFRWVYYLPLTPMIDIRSRHEKTCLWGLRPLRPNLAFPTIRKLSWNIEVLRVVQMFQR